MNFVKLVLLILANIIPLRVPCLKMPDVNSARFVEMHKTIFMRLNVVASMGQTIHKMPSVGPVLHVILKNNISLTHMPV